MINNCQIAGNTLKSLKPLPSPTSSWQLGHESLAWLSFPEAIPSLQAGDDLKPRGLGTLWQNCDMGKKRETGWAAGQRITVAGMRMPAPESSDFHHGKHCQTNHLLLYSQLQNVSCSSSSNCSERKEIEKLFLHPWHSRCFYKLKKKRY